MAFLRGSRLPSGLFFLPFLGLFLLFVLLGLLAASLIDQICWVHIIKFDKVVVHLAQNSAIVDVRVLILGNKADLLAIVSG